MVRLIDVPPAEQAARIRAAIGHSGLESREVAKRLGMSYATLRRRYDRNEPSGVASAEELYAIADICGVPRAFMEEGYARFDSATAGGSLESRLRALEATDVDLRASHVDLRELLDRLAEVVAANSDALEDRLRQLADESLAQETGTTRASDRQRAARKRTG